MFVRASCWSIDNYRQFALSNNLEITDLAMLRAKGIRANGICLDGDCNYQGSLHNCGKPSTVEISTFLN